MGNLFAKDFSELSLKPINEVAEELKIEPYILRFWESKFPQISPSKGKGNRRLYNNNDIESIKTIKDLLYNQGYTIEGAKKFLNNQDESIVPEESKISNDNSQAITDIINELKLLKTELDNL